MFSIYILTWLWNYWLGKFYSKVCNFLVCYFFVILFFEKKKNNNNFFFSDAQLHIMWEISKILPKLPTLISTHILLRHLVKRIFLFAVSLARKQLTFLYHFVWELILKSVLHSSGSNTQNYGLWQKVPKRERCDHKAVLPTVI